MREAPADVRTTGSTSARGRRFADIEIVPHENLTARVVLPPDLVPVESSLLGRVTDGQWSATYVSPPPDGIHVRLTFEAPAPDPLRLFVVLTTAGLPGGTGPFRLQLPWLSLERSTWSARSIHIVDASPSQP